MATIDVANAALDLTHPSAHAHVYQTGHIPVAIDLAAAAAKKGSALVAGDILRIMRIPPKTVAAGATLDVITPVGTDTTTLTVGVGVESVDTSRFISGFNLKTATAGTFATDAATPTRIIVGNGSGDYLTLVLSTLTGTLTSGVVNVAIGLLDLSDPARSAGLATRT